MGIELREANGVASFWFGHLIFFLNLWTTAKKNLNETKNFKKKKLKFIGVVTSNSSSSSEFK